MSRPHYASSRETPGFSRISACNELEHWFGELPDGWKLIRMSALGDFSASGIDKKSVEDESPVRMVNYTDVYGNRSRTLTNARDYMVVTCSEEKKRRHQIEVGDLLFTPSSETIEEIGESAVVIEPLPDTVFSYHLIRFQFRKEVDLHLKKYLCNHPPVLNQLSAVSKGTTRKILTRDDFRNLLVCLPPESRQGEIANFLDRETSRIDSLIEKKQRLIELLEEKRTALISRAVTKGLDPSVPMKDSGVEWLGEIPSHWDVIPLKRIGSLNAGAGFPESEQGLQDEELPFYKVGDMSTGKTWMESPKHTVSRRTARRLRAYVFPPQSIVFAKVGAALLLNRRRLLRTPSCLDNNMMAFMPRDCDAKWAFYWLSGLDLSRLANPGAVPSVNEGQMRETPVVLPPENEQRAIAAFLDREIKRIDRLIAKIRDGSERFREYRTALISAAVTGKIDVRETTAA